ncbi:MAG: hypothetical protein J5845_09300 [Lachnospiraceae bacterium]|nr:hypothetical protein [Lachnospiraceae bacterium]
MYDAIMDQYHRALKRFRAELSETKSSTKLKGLIARNGRHEERLSDVSYDIKIEDDWMDRIEAAIPHLEAAIREDRQFIKSEGNISPIERVRKVSRSSVEHLARHSEMITHVPDEGEDLIPDKLKVYENESNYAVYENRVLYMVICYARDFIDHRYFRINNAWKERSAEMEFAKKVSAPGGAITFELKLCDNTGGFADDEVMEVGRKIARIEGMSGSLAMLLNMPLMREMALAPMATPPITRTNVLRMDTHFKEVVALYDFLSSYEKDGFTMEKRENRISPFPSEMEEEITELVLTSMYLNFKYGKNAADELEANYQAEEKRREEERRQRFEELYAKGEMSPEQIREYLVSIIEDRDDEIEILRRKLAEAERVQAALDEAGIRQRALEDRVKQVLAEKESVAGRLAAEKKQEMLRAEGLEKETAMLKQVQMDQLNRNRYLEARLIGLMEAYGIEKPVKDMTEKEAFLELEKEREAFEQFYLRNWKGAKKKIRKRILWGRK